MAGNTGYVNSIRILTAGSGYLSPVVTLEGGGGDGAAAVAFVDENGAISEITIINGGYGYNTPPTVTITDSANEGVGATADATLSKDSGIALDFPPNPVVDQVYTAENGIAYICVSADPVVWQVVEVSSSQGQRLWFRNADDNSIQPIFPGDDVLVVDSAGNVTTRIFSGGQSGDTTEIAAIKTDNILFNHMPSLP